MKAIESKYKLTAGDKKELASVVKWENY
jgi:hypothetical protein